MAFKKGSLETKRDKQIKNKNLKSIKMTDIELKAKVKILISKDSNKQRHLILKFKINDIIKPAPRPRISGKSNSFYNPSSSYREYFKKQIEHLLEEELKTNHNFSKYFSLKEFPLENIYGKISLSYQQTPQKSYSKKKFLYALLNIFKLTKKPDLDNVLKEFMDICNDKIFKDDSCIIEAHLYKSYGYSDNTEITLELFDNIPTNGRLSKEELAFEKQEEQKVIYKGEDDNE